MQQLQSLHFAGMQNNSDTGSEDRDIVMNSYDIKCRIIEEELKTFWPQWRVIRCLGEGTFGDVFEINRDDFGILEKSAMKMIRIRDGAETVALIPPSGEAVSRAKDQDGSTEIPEAFRNEIQIMEELKGAPNIVIIEDYHFKRDESAAMLFVRMELLTSFQQMITERQRDQLPFTIPEVLKIGRDICTALMYCEERGIIHRDIKPANLFKDSFGNYKVGDFGVSRRMDTVHMALTMTGIGTISYMAPEVYRGTSYNNTVDIYALGLILYQLLNNYRIPFLPTEGSYTTKDIDSANYKRFHGEAIPSLAGIRIGDTVVDDSLDAMIRKACALRSEDRYQSAKAFNEDLAAWETIETKQPQESIAQRQPQAKNPQESIPQRQPQAKNPQEDIPERKSQEKKLHEDKSKGQSLAKNPQEGIPKRQPQGNLPKKIQRQDIPHQEQLSQRRKHLKNAGLPGNKELSGTTYFSFVEDDQDSGKDNPKNRVSEPQPRLISGEETSASGGSRSPDLKSDNKEKQNGQKKGIPDFVIPAVLIVITILLLWNYFFPIKLYWNNQERQQSAKPSEPTIIEDSSASGEVVEGTISDSWDEIIAAGEDGTYAEKYHIGDMKELDLGEEGVIRMELVALDADELADGSGKAHMTWIAKDLLNSDHCMNEDDTSEGGWLMSDMRTWLRESILPLFPENIRSTIKEVTKYSSGDKGTISSNDSIWIPSAREVFEIGNFWYSDVYERSGADYSSVFSDDESRVKYKTGTSSTSWWLLRSAYGNSSFTRVITNGSYSNIPAHYKGGVAIGFCL